MRGMSDTIARLAAAAQRWSAEDNSGSTDLRILDDFGSNPGALDAFVHIPIDLQCNAPLVVILHGCTQSAGGYDKASGWSKLADEHGFALLFPAQRRANNANGCFNWFEASDTRRNSGETLSILQMIGTIEARHAIDPDRIFITGLSAGGAMAATLLATYPEIFAGGAIIAGLPHGVAGGMVQAFDRMRGHGLPTPAKLQAALREASDHEGPWPRISIWHGSADATVNPTNAEAIAAQWRGVHNLADRPSGIDRIDNVPHRFWCGSDGQVLLEEYIMPGMGHGTPIKTSGSGAYGSSAPYMLDVGISSTLRIAQFWEIVDGFRTGAMRTNQITPETVPLPGRIEPRRLQGARVEPSPAHASAGVGKVIEDALRAAGLLE